MRILVFILVLLPLGSIAQNEHQEGPPPFSHDTISLYHRMFSLTSPVQMLSVLSDSKIVNTPPVTISTTPSEVSNLVSLQAGIISTNLIYAVLHDSIALDTSVARMLLFSTFNNFHFPDLKELGTDRQHPNQDTVITELMQSYQTWSANAQNNGQYASHDLFLIGEWLESSYLLSCAAVRDTNELVIKRISEQGSQVGRIIQRLNEIGDKENLGDLVAKMVSLQLIYNEIKSEYHYAEPTQNTEQHVTTFGHSTETEVPEGIEKKINQQLLIIRSTICN